MTDTTDTATQSDANTAIDRLRDIVSEAWEGERRWYEADADLFDSIIASVEEPRQNPEPQTLAVGQVWQRTGTGGLVRITGLALDTRTDEVIVTRIQRIPENAHAPRSEAPATIHEPVWRTAFHFVSDRLPETTR